MIFGAPSPKKIQVSCPACGHRQWEYAAVERTFCRSCGERIGMGGKGAGQRPPGKVRMKVERREIGCLDCGHVMAVPEEAQSWQCPGCSAYLDLQDHVVNKEQASPIRTYGRVVVEPRGVLGGAKVECAGAEIAGRVVGRLMSRGEVVVCGEARLLGGAEGTVLEIEPGAKAEAGAGLEFENIQVRGQMRAKDVRARRVEVASGGILQAETLRVESLSVAPGGWLEARLETALPEQKSATAQG